MKRQKKKKLNSNWIFCAINCLQNVLVRMSSKGVTVSWTLFQKIICAVWRKVQDIFGLDTRSLALFRILVAGTALWDFSDRSRDLRAHYSVLFFFFHFIHFRRLTQFQRMLVSCRDLCFLKNFGINTGLVMCSWSLEASGALRCKQISFFFPSHFFFSKDLVPY